MTYCPLCETHILAGDEVELVLGMQTHSACARMERRMARSTPGSRGYERAGGSQRSGAATPSSDAGGAGRVSASSGVPRALATVGEGAGQRAPRPTAHTLHDWGADDIYAIHDGLEPDELLDIEVELEEFRDGWNTADRVVVYGAAALLVVYLVGLALGWWT